MLAIAPVTANDHAPDRWLVFLHGLLGTGANWRTFARRLVEARPDWGALLVDLRLHGDSQGMPGPHTLEAAARDVVESTRDRRVVAALGHSFGGKVGIAMLELLPLDALFVIDSTPDARPTRRGSSGVAEVVDLLMTLPDEFPDRKAFLAWAEERGVSRPVAMWLAMNVRPIPNTTRMAFRVDIASVRAMMEDYFARDLWPVIERGITPVHFIVGGRSAVFDEADTARARQVSEVTVDVVPEAGHWVHVDAPDVLFELVMKYLPA